LDEISLFDSIKELDSLCLCLCLSLSLLCVKGRRSERDFLIPLLLLLVCSSSSILSLCVLWVEDVVWKYGAKMDLGFHIF
jgi:hypothetical protein